VDSRLLEHRDRPDRVIELGTRAFRELVDRLAARQRQGCLALRGEVLLRVDGETVLVKAGDSSL
jgi:hypothetical protein